MQVVEIFYSLQGEGKYAGTPSVFLRLGGCNFRCSGFGVNGCDSNYAVAKNDSWQTLDAQEIIKRIKALNAPQNADLVITGGEPTLYIDALKEVLYEFKNRRITIETNASLEIDFEKNQEFKNATFAMSVKLANSGEEYGKRVNIEAIRKIAANAKAFFKFVLKDEKDVSEIKEVIKIAPNVDVFCMPLGATQKGLEKTAKTVFEICMDNGWKYSDRLHIRIFNDKKGV